MLVTVVIVWTQVDRYLDPVGEKTVFVMQPGAADFVAPFEAARALLMQVNPYWNDIPELKDPFTDVRGAFVATSSNGRTTTNTYPPSLFVLHVPFALVTSDWREAGRVMFKLNIAILFLLAWLAWWFVVRIGEVTAEDRASSMILVPLLFFLLAANGESSFGLERGQSDFVAAALCWGALASLLMKRIAVSSFLATTVLLTKGYSLLFTGGLLLLMATRGRWVGATAGAILALFLFLVPVAEYLPDAKILVVMRAQVFTADWYNHSFANVFWNISPQLVTSGRWGMIGVACLATLISWGRLRKAHANGPLSQAALWGVVFAICSLATVIGGANVSRPYNLVYLLPGLLVLFTQIRAFTEACGLRLSARHVMAGSTFIAGGCLFALEPLNATLTLPGIGLVLVILTITASLLVGMVQEVATAQGE